MATEAQIAANRRNAQASTGPRTPEGKAASSRNATTLGLYSHAGYVRPDETDLYLEFCAGYQHALAPEGAIEHTLAAEIMHAAWRLRRCSIVESGWSTNTGTADNFLDPMEDRIFGPIQDSIDRSRARNHRILHRAMTELRLIQTERHFRAQALRDELLPDDFDATKLGLATCKIVARGPRLGPSVNRTQSVPRNSPCICGSGLKYKRCCGQNAPAILSVTAINNDRAA